MYEAILYRDNLRGEYMGVLWPYGRTKPDDLLPATASPHGQLHFQAVLRVQHRRSYREVGGQGFEREDAAAARSLLVLHRSTFIRLPATIDLSLTLSCLGPNCDDMEQCECYTRGREILESPCRMALPWSIPCQGVPRLIGNEIISRF